MLDTCGFNVNLWRSKAYTSPVVSSFIIKAIAGNNLSAVIKIPNIPGKSITPDDLRTILVRVNIEGITLSTKTELMSEFEVLIWSAERLDVVAALLKIVNVLVDAMQIIDAYRLSGN